METEPLLIDKNGVSGTTARFYTNGIVRKGLGLSWHDVSIAAVKENGKLEPILQHVGGDAPPGKMLAIMGPSGAGKSTLMDVLAGRIDNKKFQSVGTLSAYEASEFKSCSDSSLKLKQADIGFVYQDDLFVETLTALEHLRFSIKFVYKTKLTEEKINFMVNQLLHKFRLTSCKEAIIGSASGRKGLSGGEKKRLSLATALILAPKILFADEPTTGLDANSALDVVRTLSGIGSTVICTVHQPSSEIMSNFDRILLLAAGGRVAAYGSGQECLNFFESINRTCPETWNPGDFFVHEVSIVPFQEGESRSKINQICQAFKSSNKSFISEDYGCHYGLEIFDRPTFSNLKSSFHEFSTIFMRSWIESIRDVHVHQVRFAAKLFVALVLGFIYSGINLEHPNENTVHTVQTIFYMIMAESTFQCSYGFQHHYPHDLPLSRRENDAGFYQPGTLYLAKMMAFMPGIFLEVFVSTAVVYYLTGLYVINMFGLVVTVGITFACSVIAAGYGAFLGLVFFSSPSLAGCTQSITNLVILIFAGFFMVPSAFPVYIRWFRFFSWFYYGFRILVKYHWSQVGNVIDCRSSNDNLDCVHSGNDVLEGLDMNDDGLLTSDVAGMCLLVLFYHSLAYIMLKIRLKWN